MINRGQKLGRVVQRLSGLCLLLWTLSPLGAVNASAQQDAQALIEQFSRWYADFQFERVLNTSRTSLDTTALSPGELTRVHELRALSYASLGRFDEAEAEFERLLRKDPDYRLDPVEVSPKVVSILERARRQSQRAEDGRTDIFVKWLNLQRQQKSARWRSLVLPGWGHLYQQRRTKGVLLVSASLTSAAGLALSHYQYDRYRGRYFAAQSQSGIDANYVKYNRYFRVRNTFIWSTALIWVYAYFDVELYQPKLDTGRFEIGLAPSRGRDELVRLSVSF